MDPHGFMASGPLFRFWINSKDKQIKEKKYEEREKVDERQITWTSKATVPAQQRFIFRLNVYGQSYAVRPSGLFRLIVIRKRSFFFQIFTTTPWGLAQRKASAYREKKNAEIMNVHSYRERHPNSRSQCSSGSRTNMDSGAPSLIGEVRNL
jgi:hypothetical protein